MFEDIEFQSPEGSSDRAKSEPQGGPLLQAPVSRFNPPKGHLIEQRLATLSFGLAWPATPVRFQSPEGSSDRAKRRSSASTGAARRSMSVRFQSPEGSSDRAKGRRLRLRLRYPPPRVRFNPPKGHLIEQSESFAPHHSAKLAGWALGFNPPKGHLIEQRTTTATTRPTTPRTPCFNPPKGHLIEQSSARSSSRRPARGPVSIPRRVI